MPNGTYGGVRGRLNPPYSIGSAGNVAVAAYSVIANIALVVTLQESFCYEGSQACEGCDDREALSVEAQDHGDDEADCGAYDTGCRGKNGRDRHHGEAGVWDIVEEAL